MSKGLPPEIENWVGLNARRMVLALDYDGTLVPICQKPEQARPDLELLPLLQALALEVILAILTGRNRKDMTQWIPDPAVTLVTSHGAEWRHDGVWRPLLLTQGNPGSLKTLAKRLELAFENVPGVILEKKGATVAFHYRLVDPLSLPGLLDRFERLVGRWKEENAGFEVLEGKAVREIRPQGLEKGRALKRFLAVLDLEDTPVMAMGDDRTDEDMFRSLKDGDLSILVGGGDTSAAVRLRDVGEARHVLREILRIRQNQRQESEDRSQESESKAEARSQKSGVRIKGIKQKSRGRRQKAESKE